MTSTYKVLARNQPLYLNHLRTPYTVALNAWVVLHCSHVPAVSTFIDRRRFSYAAHLRYGTTCKSLSKFAIALPWLLLRSVLIHFYIYFTHYFPLVPPRHLSRSDFTRLWISCYARTYKCIIIILNTVRCPYTSVTVGMASSVANDVTIRMTSYWEWGCERSRRETS